jgi:hypothetical protein
MMTQSKCTAVGCVNGKITLLSKVVDCKECNGTGQIWKNLYHTVPEPTAENAGTVTYNVDQVVVDWNNPNLTATAPCPVFGQGYGVIHQASGIIDNGNGGIIIW